MGAFFNLSNCVMTSFSCCSQSISKCRKVHVLCSLSTAWNARCWRWLMLGLTFSPPLSRPSALQLSVSVAPVCHTSPDKRGTNKSQHLVSGHFKTHWEHRNREKHGITNKLYLIAFYIIAIYCNCMLHLHLQYFKLLENFFVGPFSVDSEFKTCSELVQYHMSGDSLLRTNQLTFAHRDNSPERLTFAHKHTELARFLT